MVFVTFYHPNFSLDRVGLNPEAKLCRIRHGGTQAQLESTRSALETKQQAVTKADKELASVTAQVGAARKNAQDQEASLKEQVQAAMREAGVKEAEVQEVARIKRDLAQHNLKAPALVAVAGEFSQGASTRAPEIPRVLIEEAVCQKHHPPAASVTYSVVS